MFNPIGNSDNDQDDVYGTLFRDVILVMAAGLIAMLLIILPYINDPKEEEESDVTAPGNVIFEVYWRDDVNVDIDGWVQGPLDNKPVGFLNRSDIQFNLLRDDRGKFNDVSERNYENFFSRGVVAGEYIFNVHWYAGDPPIEGFLDIKILVSVKNDNKFSDKSDGRAKQILLIKTQLVKHQDKTVVRFELDEKGELVYDSLDYTYVNLKGQHGLRNNNEDDGR